MQKRISDLIQENLLLKNCLNNENLNIDLNQQQIPLSVIVAGSSCIQEKKQIQTTKENLNQKLIIFSENNNNNELNSLNNISESNLQQSNNLKKNFQTKINDLKLLLNNNNNLLTNNFSNNFIGNFLYIKIIIIVLN